MDLKIFISLLIMVGVCQLCVSQTRSIPDTIVSCYQNSTAYNRYTRQPMHIENLIAIIRKIEEKTFYQWDMRRIARTVLKKFQFDGMSYDPDRRPGYQFETDSLEDHRTSIVHDLLGGEETLPDGALDNDERCALHWMLSHSINATMRDDEVSRNFRLRAKRSPLKKDFYDTDDFYDDYDKSVDDSGKAVGKKDTNVDEDVENIAKDHDYQGDAEHFVPGGVKFARATNWPTTKQPLETGIVYTKWGAISAGKLIGGIAAGLEPLQLPVTDSNSGSYIPNFGAGSGTGSGTNNNNPGNSWGTGSNSGGNNWGGSGGGNSNQWSASKSRWAEPTYPRSRYSNGRKKRQTGGGDFLPPVLNYHAATLAGDVAQAAILNAVFQAPTSLPPPSGTFNDSICPREYIMDSLSNPNADVSHDHDSWTYMTAAEIRGGIDGLVLATKVQEWELRHKYRLSQLLEMYYSEHGVTAEPRFRACNRGAVYSSSVNANDVLQQSKSFAYVYNNRTRTITVGTAENIQGMYSLVEEAYRKMTGFASSLSSIDYACQRRESSGTTEMPENDKWIPPRTTLYAVLDHTDTTDQDLSQQKRFVADLAYELEVSPFGSRIGLVNGATGQILIKPNFTDNAAIFACRVLSERTFSQTQNGIVTTLQNLQTEIQKIKSDEERFDYADNNGIVIMLLNQGKKLEDGLRNDVMSKFSSFTNELGDVHIMHVTSRYQLNDYDNFVLNRDMDVIKIQSSANLSTETSKFRDEFVKRNHARITYPKCNANRYDQSQEHTLGTDLFVSPNTIQYYKISADYFFSAKDLRFRFSSDNGKVRICFSRWERFPNNQNVGDNSVECYETSGQYQPPGSSTSDLEKSYRKPCGGDGKRDGCEPIYLSITPISFPVAGSVGLDCSVDKCQYSDQVKVTFTHWDMRCNSNTAFQTLVSLPILLVTVLLSVTFTTYS